MREYSNPKIWSIAFLLLVFSFSPGCCKPGANPDLATPVVSVVPLAGAVGVCSSAAVTITFSLPMQPATINAATFVVTAGTPPVAVAGAIASDPTNTIFTFTPSSALALNTLYTATITTGATDVYGIALASNMVWSFTTAAEPCASPAVISTIPLPGAGGVCPNAPVSATFSEAMNPTTINATTFTLTGPGATPVAGVVTYAGLTATFTPNSALAVSTLYTATITTGAQNLNGGALPSNYPWSFTTAAEACAPPTVISVTPFAGAAGVCPSTAVTATFSEAMNPATINATTFTLTGPGATPVMGVVTYAGSTATFTPNSALAVSTLYTATITTGATDENGVALASNVVWTFTTAAEPCGPPTVISVSPLAVGVCPSTAVSAIFSEAMNPTTINTTTFTLTGPGATPVTGVVTYAGSTATFTPSTPLALSTVYTATITTGVQNLNGTALASNYPWNFTTAAAACTPTVISVAPANGSSGICPNTLVVATFSEAMNPATIDTTTFTLAASGTPVAGTVAYVASTNVATFTPTSPLALDTLYTATITTGAQDLAGAPLAADYVWTFTTSATACQAIVPLGSTCTFGILGASTVTSTGPSDVAGNIGVWPGPSIAGFPPATLTGTEYIDDTVSQTAQGDLTTAYEFAAAAPGGAVLPADIGGETLAPGVYKTTSAQPSLAITGNLTLSGNGVYIFQIVSTLTTAANNSNVILSGGAIPGDVFWQVGSSATLGTTTTFQGIIMAQASVSLDTGATLDGSALARTGAVTLQSNPVNVPPCPAP